MNRRLLNGENWTCRLPRADPTIAADVPSTPLPAVVPGCIHTDLIRAGVVGHPNIADNELRTQWIGRCDWQYQCEFEADAKQLEHERIDLVFETLDTIATIRLNGVEVGRAANQFHPHRFDARSAIRPGRNELTIDLKSPINHIHAEAARLGPRPVNGDWDPYVFMRRSACNFGWDWGPKVATVGVAGDVRLETWRSARIESMRPLISRDADGSWMVKVHIEIARSDGEARLRIGTHVILSDGEKTLCEQKQEITGTAGELTLRIPSRDVTPWMPRGNGGQRLYDLQVSLSDAASSIALDAATRRIGFRTVTLDTSLDSYGSRFQLRVNDQPVVALGANWIPEGLFPEDRTDACIRERIGQAAAANLNTLRVWGGGTYESDAFYEACDELGILVWQDFMFACACYPEEEPIRSQVETEARYQIARLSSHPSVALWCGGNECIWSWQGWGFDKKLQPGQTWGRGYWLDLLPKLCAELDPTRPYWPNTPWSGSLDADVQDPNHGTRHTWDKQVEGYRDFVPRFSSEFGHQSPPNYSTIQESLGNQQIETWLRDRQRASGGNTERYDKPLAEHFVPARDFDDWLYQAHVLQARAISIGIEWARIHRDRCGGAIFWQLNDAWAGHSWSAIDCAGRLKPLWYAVRSACAPRLLTIQPIDGRPRLFAVNEINEPWKGIARARRIRFDGSTQCRAEIPYTIGSYDSAMLLDLADALGPQTDPSGECVIVDEIGATTRSSVWFFERDINLKLEPPRARATCEVRADSIMLKITAETLLRDLVVAADRVLPDAVVSDQLLTILPGESTTITIAFKSRPQQDSAAVIDSLLSPAVLRCSNGAVQVQRP